MYVKLLFINQSCPLNPGKALSSYTVYIYKNNISKKFFEKRKKKILISLKKYFVKNFLIYLKKNITSILR